jgi:GH43 family beta-xylosidase
MHDTYQNPVYRENFPDPFVLKWCGEYWAYCTGVWRDGRCFGVLRSRDLVEWVEVGGAMEPLPGDLPHYWAPEVGYVGGRFYLYYSAGDELNDMAVRVAVADHPAGPFVDAGRRLTGEPFAIDAHVFADDDGTRYLFYATDYLEHSHIGTGTAMTRLADPLTPAGEPRPVTRARYDWQIYDPERKEKGGVRWHTVEGPFVLKRKGRYYQMFSGGNWQNPSYGVSFATSDRIERPDEWEQAADGQRILPIIGTIPGRVIGPGHNSAVRGPDNRQLYCVYHRWLDAGRAMAIDPLDWAGERMLVLGPSDEPRPAPNPPVFAAAFDEIRAGDLGAGWECSGGSWRVGGGVAYQEAALHPARALCTVAAPCFLAEVSARALEEPEHGASPGSGSYGLSLEDASRTLLYLLVSPAGGHATVLWHGADGWSEESLPLPAGFAAAAFELLRAEVDGSQVRLTIGEGAPQWRGICAAPPTHVALRTSGRAAAFAGFAITAGFEDLFDQPAPPEQLGWRIVSGGWSVESGALRASPEGGAALAVKGHAFERYELVVSTRLASDPAEGGYTLHPALRAGDLGPSLSVEQGAAGWVAVWRDGAEVRRYELPHTFEAGAPQPPLLRREGERLAISWEAHQVCEVPLAPGPASVGLGASGQAAFDMVRLTALGA